MAKVIKDKQFVFKKHIEKGIERYKGMPNETIQRHLDNANWKFKAFLFEDGRVLLVYHDESYGVLYKSENYLYEVMELMKET